ncbi:5-formyltetrahydrofolate cyclo-ligase [Bacillus manliponensis]|uniref:5-formyltetrahydrofolate cyclo-ligase n=1 Tax=Bacillus manliponensis TaxID=574376 RepID=UPI00351235EA
MREEKQQLRKSMLQNLHSLSTDDHITLSEKIEASLYKQKEWKEAEVIGITLSMGKEVHTDSIIERAWKEGKKVVVPKCERGTGKMTFRCITNFDQLETVYMKLREPIPSITEIVEPQQMDLLVVPGVVFTRDGFRIGYGGGYYDRYLEHYKGNTLSLAFQFQVVPYIPTEPFDQPVQKIITEKETICNLRLV